ncbi:HU family DNA-binding protein [Shimia sp. R9_2]|nr:HU family DNA-binding protein [Shimia sp. R9_2]
MRAKATTKTRARSTSTRKTSTSLRDAPKGAKAIAEEAVAPVVEEAAAAAEEAEAFRKRDLIEAVVMRSGVKKRDVKPAVEAALAILGETLAQGQGLNLPELGKVKIQNQKSVGDVQVLNLRLRRKLADAETETKSGDAESDKEGLAEAAE